MRIEGDIKVIHDIEVLLKRRTWYEVMENKKIIEPLPWVRPEDTPALIHKKLRVYIQSFVFDIELRYDRRNNTGRFDLNDKDSQFLFIYLPQLTVLLSRLDKFGFRNFYNKILEEVPIAKSVRNV